MLKIKKSLFTHCEHAWCDLDRVALATVVTDVAVEAVPGVAPDARAASGAASAPRSPHRPRSAQLNDARLLFHLGSLAVRSGDASVASAHVRPHSHAATDAARRPHGPFGVGCACLFDVIVLIFCCCMVSTK